VTDQDQDVRIVDLHMPFGSMVVFMVKWAIAAIPAAIILFLAYMALVGLFYGLYKHVH
jgi:hypothetical protein